MSFISEFYSCVFVKNRINLELFIYFFEHDIMNISYSQYERKANSLVFSWLSFYWRIGLGFGIHFFNQTSGG